MELSASRTVRGEREIQRVENDHFSVVMPVGTAIPNIGHLIIMSVMTEV